VDVDLTQALLAGVPEGVRRVTTVCSNHPRQRMTNLASRVGKRRPADRATLSGEPGCRVPGEPDAERPNRFVPASRAGAKSWGSWRAALVGTLATPHRYRAVGARPAGTRPRWAPPAA
jgi:hypothetical protein